ncbi:GAP family protein [Nocardia implantans]|uniref:GAP family protein n=1 Tax=Nocardia implantans TaxID=3108168 RepID=A0ABU6AYJ9_9NOCA|nr:MULTISPECIES: GAP family protein [unclassified Nocardia]MBF6190572.1 GAP family protein [Nocardia beijingensis]MEA3528485.1 GAP family protein [Nocardia sp. CDC192]MEB3512363.1 GAP family protein [Nocardia sp. CDC186]
MWTLLLALAGFAFLDSLDLLLIGVTTAVVYDSRVSRRSPLVSGLSLLAGVFAVTTAFGICTILGIGFLTDLFDFRVTPAVRYWGELVAGVVLIALASIRMGGPAAPERATALRRQPWVLAGLGVAIGIAQAPTAVPYLAGLAMISARHPLPALWPLIVVAYCALALLPPLVILGLAMRRTTRARRMYRKIVRIISSYGPASVRVLFAIFGVVLLCDALVHYRSLWP